MQKTPVLFASLLVLALPGCKSKETPAPDGGLDGTWRLTNRQCDCPMIMALPNETLTLTDNTFAFISNGQVGLRGSYAQVSASPRCIVTGGPAPTLRMSSPTWNMRLTEVQYTLAGNTLTLDYGGPCDAPVDTYRRLP